MGDRVNSNEREQLVRWMESYFVHGLSIKDRRGAHSMLEFLNEAGIPVDLSGHKEFLDEKFPIVGAKNEPMVETRSFDREEA